MTARQTGVSLEGNLSLIYQVELSGGGREGMAWISHPSVCLLYFPQPAVSVGLIIGVTEAREHLILP